LQWRAKPPPANVVIRNGERSGDGWRKETGVGCQKEKNKPSHPCCHCGGQHWDRDCKTEDNGGQQQRGRQFQVQKAGRADISNKECYDICSYVCGRRGHLARTCPQKKVPEEPSLLPRHQVNVAIHSQQFDLIVDTGCSASLVPESLVESLPNKPPRYHSSIDDFLVPCSFWWWKVEVNGTCHAQVSWAEWAVTLPFEVVAGNTPFLLSGNEVNFMDNRAQQVALQGVTKQWGFTTCASSSG